MRRLSRQLGHEDSRESPTASLHARIQPGMGNPLARRGAEGDPAARLDPSDLWQTVEVAVARVEQEVVLDDEGGDPLVPDRIGRAGGRTRSA